jgi:hypothetical protein
MSLGPQGSLSRLALDTTMKNGLGNLAARDVGQLGAIVKNRLKRIQYRPALIDGCPHEIENPDQTSDFVDRETQ